MNDFSNLSEFKKQLFKVYNDINKEIYGFGVIELKINILDDMIVFITRHNRVHALVILEENYCQLKEAVDKALFTEFKSRLRKVLKENMGIDPQAILRDYDPDYKVAATIVMLDSKELKKYK